MVSLNFQIMSATAHSPTSTTTTTATNSSTTNHLISYVAPYSSHPEDLSPVCEPNSASSPLYSGCGGGCGRASQDNSVAILGHENESFRVGPQLTSSTPVKGDEEDPQQQSTPLSTDPMGPPASASVGKRKRDSLESDCSIVMPSEGRVTRSVKRLKRLNSTAMRKGLRRNLSFNAMKSPFAKMLRRGRSSMMDTSTTSQLDCSDMTDCGIASESGRLLEQIPDNPPTFKTPIALPPINKDNTSAVADWRAKSLFGDSICLPEIQEEESIFVVVEQPEGKRAPAEADPAVEYLLIICRVDLLNCSGRGVR